MELVYDWRGFRRLFPQSEAKTTSENTPISLVVNQGTIIAAKSGSHDLKKLVGRSVDVVAAEYGSRKISIYDASQVESWVNEASDLPHFYEQTHFLKVESEQFEQKHFLLDSVEGWWAKVLPSSYGIFLRIEGKDSEQDLFLVVRKARVESFHKPDFSWMGPDKNRDAAHVVKFLAEKHLLPVQGVFLREDEWFKWNQSSQPWKDVAASVKSKNVKLVPFRFGVASLMATRAFLKF